MKKLKTILPLLTIIVTTFLAGNYIHWMAIYFTTALVCSFLFKKAWKAAIMGFIGVALSWSGLHIITDIRNDFILYPRIAQLLQLNSGFLLQLALAFIGGLIGLFGGWTGVEIKNMIFKKKQSAKT